MGHNGAFMLVLSLFMIGCWCEILPENINELRASIRQVIDQGGNNHQLLGRIVRLAFHDCAGPYNEEVSGCNGCVDFENDDHAGLSSVIAPLEPAYEAWSGDMSRADFWSLAATVALEYAQELDTLFPDDTLESIPFYFGRTDCDTSPDATITKEFVGAAWGWTEVFAWFEDHLHLGDRETVALIGAHTLGKAHQQWSGYSSERWKRRGPDMLNNEFYQNLVSLQYTQQESPTGKWEWRVDVDGRDVMMLNADMCMFIDIDDQFDPQDDDRVLCTIDTCDPSPVRSIVNEFANDNQLWLTEFREAWLKMITTGYIVSDLTVVEAPLPGQSAHSEGGQEMYVLKPVDLVQNEHTVHGMFGYSRIGVVFLVFLFAAVWLCIGFFVGAGVLNKPHAQQNKLDM